MFIGALFSLSLYFNLRDIALNTKDLDDDIYESLTLQLVLCLNGDDRSSLSKLMLAKCNALASVLNFIKSLASASLVLLFYTILLILESYS